MFNYTSRIRRRRRLPAVGTPRRPGSFFMGIIADVVAKINWGIHLIRQNRQNFPLGAPLAQPVFPPASGVQRLMWGLPKNDLHKS